MGIPESAVRELCILDVDPKGNELYLLCVESAGATEPYYAILSPGYAVALLKHSGETVFSEELPRFKAENGWAYP